MPTPHPFLHRTATLVGTMTLIPGLLAGLATAASAPTVPPPSVLGDTTMPAPDDVSQTFPYGITGKTPPSLTKINHPGQKPYHKHRINLRVFQGCPQVEISAGGRLWATWFGSNVQAERCCVARCQ